MTTSNQSVANSSLKCDIHDVIKDEHFSSPSTKRLAFLAAVVLLKEPTKSNMKLFLAKQGALETRMSLFRMEKSLFNDYGVVLDRQTKYVKNPKDFRYIIKRWGIVCRFRLIDQYRDFVCELMPGMVKDHPERQFINIQKTPDCGIY